MRNIFAHYKNFLLFLQKTLYYATKPSDPYTHLND